MAKWPEGRPRTPGSAVGRRRTAAPRGCAAAAVDRTGAAGPRGVTRPAAVRRRKRRRPHEGAGSRPGSWAPRGPATRAAVWAPRHLLVSSRIIRVEIVPVTLAHHCRPRAVRHAAARGRERKKEEAGALAGAERHRRGGSEGRRCVVIKLKIEMMKKDSEELVEWRIGYRI